MWLEMVTTSISDMATAHPLYRLLRRLKPLLHLPVEVSSLSVVMLAKSCPPSRYSVPFRTALLQYLFLPGVATAEWAVQLMSRKLESEQRSAGLTLTRILE